MQPSFDTWTIIFLFAAVQGIFLSFLLFLHKKGNRKANNILAILIGLFSVTLLYYVMYWTGYAVKYIWMNGWVGALPFLFGPLTHRYIKTLDERAAAKNVWLHFIPFYIHFLYIAPVIFRNIYGRAAILHSDIYAGSSVYGRYIPVVFIILQCISIIIYGILCIRYIKNDKQKLSLYSLEAEKIKHKWLQRITVFYCIFGLASVGYWLLVATRLIALEYDYAISAAMSVFIYMTGYMGFRQPAIFNEILVMEEIPFATGKMEVQHIRPVVKYGKSALRSEEALTYRDRLLKYMETEKPYLKNDLKIQDIAKYLKLSTHHLSQIVNDMLEMNYADFINGYRIREAQKILADPETTDKIISVAYDVGYNNKATFNSAFKKITGLTPSSYRKLSLDPASEKIGSKFTG